MVYQVINNGLDLDLQVHMRNKFLISQPNVLGTQKNSLNETFLLSPQNTCLNH